jgi:hypothetical protein
MWQKIEILHSEFGDQILESKPGPRERDLACELWKMTDRARESACERVKLRAAGLEVNWRADLKLHLTQLNFIFTSRNWHASRDAIPVRHERCIGQPHVPRAAAWAYTAVAPASSVPARAGVVDHEDLLHWMCSAAAGTTILGMNTFYKNFSPIEQFKSKFKN